ncbi:MAG: hypothetical protein U0586_01350 [Candidatus Brocadiaceae bacterium]
MKGRTNYVTKKREKTKDAQKLGYKLATAGFVAITGDPGVVENSSRGDHHRAIKPKQVVFFLNKNARHRP